LGKSLEASKGSVWALFLTTHAVLVETIERRFADAGLPPFGWYDVMWGLERAENQKLRMSELADKVVLSRSNLTRLIDRLEDAGLVKRERSEEDRRGAFAVLTEAGKAMRKRMWPIYAKAIKDLFEDKVSDTQAQVMGTALRAVLDAARTQTSDEGAASARRARQQRAREA
jgi:DNA-binding MarR family transcriptional regulator